MGVNAIRQYAVIALPVDPRRVRDLHHDQPALWPVWHAVDGAGRQRRLRQCAGTEDHRGHAGGCEHHKDTEGVLLLLGNENNQAFTGRASRSRICRSAWRMTPSQERSSALFALGEPSRRSRSRHGHPVSICNGDIQYLELIEQYDESGHPGHQCYRPVRATSLRASTSRWRPRPFAEFGADARCAAAGDHHAGQVPHGTVGRDLCQSHVEGVETPSAAVPVVDGGEAQAEENLEIQDTTQLANKATPRTSARCQHDRVVRDYREVPMRMATRCSRARPLRTPRRLASRSLRKRDHQQDIAHFAAIDPLSYDSCTRLRWPKSA